MRYYLLYSLIILGISSSIAQSATPNVYTKKPSIKEQIYLEAGAYTAFPVSGNYLYNSSNKIGFEIGTHIILWDHLIVGVGVNQFVVRDINFSTAGYFQSTRNTALFVEAGYQYPITKTLLASFHYAIGPSYYINQLYESPDDFSDEALFNNFKLKITYSLGRVGLNLYGGYRIDILDIDVPAEISSLYNTAQFLNAGLSLSFSLE